MRVHHNFQARMHDMHAKITIEGEHMTIASVCVCVFHDKNEPISFPVHFDVFV